MILSIDIETYSEVDLGKAGVYRYAEDPSFEILLLAYAFDDDPVYVIDLTAQRPASAVAERIKLDAVITALTDPDITKSAFNANFERTCLAAHLGIPMPPEQWQDTMILASEMGLPRSLKDVGTVLGLAEDQQKMKEGRNLIQYFSKPCKPTKSNEGRTRNLPEHAPDKWGVFKTYCAQDVVTERAIRQMLIRFRVDPAEHDLWVVDQRINDRGVMFDRTFVENAVHIDATEKDVLLEEMRKISRLENPNSVMQVGHWIEDMTGARPESLDKRVIGGLIESLDGYPEVVDFLKLRQTRNKTSTTKYQKMLGCACRDDRIRGLTQFYGANRTGRWSGRLVQMQNLAKNNMPDDELDAARILVKSGDADGLRLMYEPIGALSELIRTSFVPKPGCKFIVSDFAAIEARVLAWMAGEEWRMEAFDQGADIYCASASQMFGVPVEKHGVNGHLRQKGKIAELALGYGGSVGALKAMGALDMGLTEDELQPLVDTWRASNRHITQFWWDVDKCARMCIRDESERSVGLEYNVYYAGRSIGKTRAVSEAQAKNNVRHRLYELGKADHFDDGLYEAVLDGPPGARIRMRMEDQYLRVRLPSGRELSYVKPKVTGAGQIRFEGMVQAGGWGPVETYGPKLVENIVQAVSRDCLAESMKRLERAGIPIVFHVHDEVICEVPKSNGPTAHDIAHVMGRPISWAEGLPLKADAYECDYYRKD